MNITIMKPIVNCASVLLLNERGQFLCHQRPSGLWEIPGGKMEPGENVFKAAERELLEETGIRAVRFGSELGTVVVEDSENFWNCTYVYLESYEGKPEHREPEKGTDWSWSSTTQDKNWIMSFASISPIINCVLMAKRASTPVLQECSQPSCPYPVTKKCLACSEFCCSRCYDDYHVVLNCHRCKRKVCLVKLFDQGTILCEYCESNPHTSDQMSVQTQ